jgi:hypothetical protein
MQTYYQEIASTGLIAYDDYRQIDYSDYGEDEWQSIRLR